MNSRQAEVWLAIFYISAMVFSVTSIISLVTVWQYWTWTLDSCIDLDCGCILYGINTFHTFIGGDVKLCYFGSYSLIPAILIGLCLGCYHGYRCCIHKNLDNPIRINREQAYHDDRYLRIHSQLLLIVPSFGSLKIS
jgi:hypothetical protein